MYHDQGQIAMKLMGFDRGVTVPADADPIATPAHERLTTSPAGASPIPARCAMHSRSRARWGE
jgi:hypothetical protein